MYRSVIIKATVKELRWVFKTLEKEVRNNFEIFITSLSIAFLLSSIIASNSEYYLERYVEIFSPIGYFFRSSATSILSDTPHVNTWIMYSRAIGITLFSIALMYILKADDIILITIITCFSIYFLYNISTRYLFYYPDLNAMDFLVYQLLILVAITLLIYMIFKLFMILQYKFRNAVKDSKDRLTIVIATTGLIISLITAFK